MPLMSDRLNLLQEKKLPFVLFPELHNSVVNCQRTHSSLHAMQDIIHTSALGPFLSLSGKHYRFTALAGIHLYIYRHTKEKCSHHWKTPSVGLWQLHAVRSGFL